MTLSRIGSSSLLILRSKYIPPHLLSYYPRCACFGNVVYRQQRKNENVSNHYFYSVNRTSSSTSTSSSPSSAAIRKLHQKILLPQHGQNGTLLLRSNSKSIGQVDIIPQWRDDTMLELIPIVMSENKQDGSHDGNVTNNNSSSIHDNESSAVIEVQYDHDDDESSSSTVLEKRQTISYGGLQFTLHRDGISTALGRKGSFVEVDVDIDDHLDDMPVVSSLSQLWKLVATVPEKSNITCNITKGHINVIGSKLEGDVHLATSDGDIKVSKLRGHDVTLLNNCVDVDRNTTTSCSSTTPGLIYVQKGIEAKTVRINSSNRVRARMVNGSDVSVQVVVPSTSSVTEQEEQSMNDDNNNKLDEDDAGCRIDIGSLYISGSSECEARLNVDDSDSSSTPGLVRIKSSHGHVMVHAKAKLNASLLTEVKQQQQQPQPLVDLGGVNGSCDVTLEVGADGSDATVVSPKPHEAPVTTRVHFDSLSPDSISTITSLHFGRRSDEAIVSVTVDRKVEADLRLLTLNNGAGSMPIDMDRLTSDELDDVESALLDIERYIQKSGSNKNASKTTESIYIETEAFDPLSNKNKALPQSECFQYKQGTIRNRSGEPDSRFDIRSSSSPSRGKINIDSAASQALSGFQGKKNDSDNFTADDNSHLPLLAVATNGKIKLETLSWLGAIARRYGLEGQQELGRTASRRPRLS